MIGFLLKTSSERFLNKYTSTQVLAFRMYFTYHIWAPCFWHMWKCLSACISVYLRKMVRNVDALKNHLSLCKALTIILKDPQFSLLCSHMCLALALPKKWAFCLQKQNWLYSAYSHLLLTTPWLHLTCQQNWTGKQELSFGRENKEQLFLLSSEVSNAARGYRKESS